MSLGVKALSETHRHAFDSADGGPVAARDDRDVHRSVTRQERALWERINELSRDRVRRYQDRDVYS
jgi:hypothetical protein